MRILLDENVTERLADALIKLGIDAVSSNQDYKGSDDSSLLVIAAALDRAILTYNSREFALLHLAWIAWSDAWNVVPPPSHAGILLINSAPGFDSTRLAAEVASFATGRDQTHSLANRAFAWSSTRGWQEL